MDVRHRLALMALMAFLLIVPVTAWAHVSESALVLLMPTGFYTAAGVSAVLMSVVVAAFLTPTGAARLFASRKIYLPRIGGLQFILPAAGLMVFIAAFVAGILGEQHPLENLMPLYLWTLLWLILPAVQVIFGDVWSRMNPWAFVALFLKGSTEQTGKTCWFALVFFLVIYLFAMVDVAPDAPARLAVFSGLYWLFHLGMMLWKGPGWLARGEGFTVLFALLARLSPMAGGRIGLPGHKLHQDLHPRGQCGNNPMPSVAFFAIAMLAAGSYDGINETFWWLSQIGVNPLAFPGRSQVVAPMLMGFIMAQLTLLLGFSAICFLGWCLAARPGRFQDFFTVMALALLPIAAGYHVAHYLTAFLVNGQYLKIAVTEMFHFSHAADHAEVYITTGFFNRPSYVRDIYIVQSCAIVSGHILAILLSHSFALGITNNRITALKSQAPLIVFMIAYTFLGLWLLASPRGV